MTRQDIDIIHQAVETTPHHWTYEGKDSTAWNHRGQDAQDTHTKNRAYLIAGTLQLMDESADVRPLPRTARAEAQLTATKPDQASLDTARAVLHWLADHAQYFPEEWATLGDPQATEAAGALRWAAKSCGEADALITTTAEARERHPVDQNLL